MPGNVNFAFNFSALGGKYELVFVIEDKKKRVLFDFIQD